MGESSPVTRAGVTNTYPLDALRLVYKECNITGVTAPTKLTREKLGAYRRTLTYRAFLAEGYYPFIRRYHYRGRY